VGRVVRLETQVVPGAGANEVSPPAPEAVIQAAAKSVESGDYSAAAEVLLTLDVQNVPATLRTLADLLLGIVLLRQGRADEAAAQGGGTIETTDDMDAAFEGADVVYPKSWGRLDLFTDEPAALADAARYTDWICDERRMGLAKPDSLYMHCLPADRGTEVTDAVIDGPHSVVYDEAENRMHTGKALCALTMGGYSA